MDSTGLNAFVLILGLAYFVLIVVMIVKFFGMASDLREIRRLLAQNVGYPRQSESPRPNVTASRSVTPPPTPSVASGATPVDDIFDPDKWERLKSLKMYEEVYIDGIRCSYFGLFERKHAFYPFEGQDLTGARLLIKDNVGNPYFSLTDRQAMSMMD